MCDGEDEFKEIWSSSSWNNNDFEKGHKNCGKFATAVMRQFHLRWTRLLKLIQSGAIFGKVDDWFTKWEYQSRGMVNIHMLLSLVDSSNICQHVSAIIPDMKRNVGKYKPTPKKKYLQMMRELVLKYQIHVCNDVCRRTDNIGGYEVKIIQAKRLVKLALRDLKADKFEREERDGCLEYIRTMNIKSAEWVTKVKQIKTQLEQPESTVQYVLKCKD